ncbi:hypothetical protein U9M48_042982, partial [Paspalum notatum var. saurae]
SRRIEVPRITDFTNPSAGSMMWQGLPVEDGVIWLLCQVGRPGVEPAGLAHLPVTSSLSHILSVFS